MIKNKQIYIWDGNVSWPKYVDDLIENFLTVLLDKNKSFNKTINEKWAKNFYEKYRLILSKQLKCDLTAEKQIVNQLIVIQVWIL